MDKRTLLISLSFSNGPRALSPRVGLPGVRSSGYRASWKLILLLLLLLPLQQRLPKLLDAQHLLINIILLDSMCFVLIQEYETLMSAAAEKELGSDNQEVFIPFLGFYLCDNTV